jgi:hypothetical protein
VARSSPRPRTFLANLKFNGLGLAGLFVLPALLWVRFKAPLRLASLMAAVAAAVAFGGVQGVNPYLSNAHRHGHPLYPLMGGASEPRIELIYFKNAEFLAQAPPLRLFHSIAARATNDSEGWPRLKAPFVRVELRYRSAEYSPHLWLVPALTLLLVARTESRWRHVLGGALALTMALNVILASVPALGAAVVRDAAARRQLEAMAVSSLAGELPVHLGLFGGLQRRLTDAGIAYRLSDHLECPQPAELIASTARYCLAGAITATAQSPLEVLEGLLSPTAPLKAARPRCAQQEGRVGTDGSWFGGASPGCGRPASSA